MELMQMQCSGYCAHTLVHWYSTYVRHIIKTYTTASSLCAIGIEEGLIQKRRQWSSLLFGGQNGLNSLPLLIFCIRMIWRKGWIHPILHIILVQLILFFISFKCKIASAVKKLIKFCPPTAATTFAFSSVIILLIRWQAWFLCEYLDYFWDGVPKTNKV